MTTPVTPYDAFTDSTDVVATYILDLLVTGALTLQAAVPGITVDTNPGRAFFYGEQELLPTSPAFCVIPAPETSAYNGAGGRPVLIDFQTYVMVYVNVVRDVQLNTHQAMQLGAAVKHVVHADKNLGGNVLDCFCSQMEPGYALKKGGLMAAARLTFRSKVKKILNP